ncbi:hypothetical protein [Pseudomonas aeruginosa]|uniref:hypothetical protein n=1 Tax=Pseudomonas aeruginosa TaxID=287 RepID=UPI001BD42EFB|nr:hypothetical protein [Pseudomonas aeruginosa]MBS9730335.1 hypothetical protein [Pseudomonas aeruginosa]
MARKTLCMLIRHRQYALVTNDIQKSDFFYTCPFESTIEGQPILCAVFYKKPNSERMKAAYSLTTLPCHLTLEGWQSLIADAEQRAILVTPRRIYDFRGEEINVCNGENKGFTFGADEFIHLFGKYFDVNVPLGALYADKRIGEVFEVIAVKPRN